VSLRPHDVNRLRHPPVTVGARPTEVVEGAEHVVVPVVREREVEVGGLNDRAGAPAAEQVALEEILLAAAAGRVHVGRRAGRVLELEEPFEHIDRRVERRPHRAVLDLAVPAAVVEPLGQQALDNGRHVHAEVRAGLDRPAVDARLDLAVEVPLAGVLPSPVLRHECDRSAG